MSPFKKILASGRLAPAYLVTGPEGERDLECRRFAQTLLGPKKLELHPDFLLYAPQKGMIRIEQIRELTNRLNFRPMEGNRLVVMIQDADRMTEGAANALLKTLEEPPPYLLFLLVTGVPERLPATIRSRCQKITLRPELEEPQTWEVILPLWRETILPELMKKNRSPFTVASKLAEEFSDAELIIPFLQFLKSWWRDLVVYRETGDESKLIIAKPEELLPQIETQPNGKIFESMDLILETERAIEGNVLKSLTLERLFLGLQ